MFVLVSTVIPLVLPHILSEPYMALEAIWPLKHIVVSCSSTFLVTKQSPQNNQPNIWLVFGIDLKLFGCYNLTLPIASQCALAF